MSASTEQRDPAAPRDARRAHPGARRRHGHRAPGEEPHGRGLRRPRARGLQREPGPHPARRHPRHPPRLLRGRRRRDRDQHLRRHAAGARRVRPRRSRPCEINVRAARARARGRGRGALDGRTPRFVAGSMGPTTKAISVTGGINFEALIEHLRGPGRGPDRGRRRLPAPRDRAGHAQHQGGAARHRAGLRQGGAPRARSRSRGPSSRWAPCSPASRSRRSPPRSSTSTSSTSASTAPPARSS